MANCSTWNFNAFIFIIKQTDFDEEKAAAFLDYISKGTAADCSDPPSASQQSFSCLCRNYHISELLKSNQMDDVVGATETPPGVRGQRNCKLKK